jgi:parallel beta-helix repeat protein
VQSKRTLWIVSVGSVFAVLVLAGCTIPGHIYTMGMRKAGQIAPVSPTPVCNQPILNSPWNYTGTAGAYTSGTAGLPTFGSAGTDFPHATSGVVVAPHNLNNEAYDYNTSNTVYYFEPGEYVIQNGLDTGVTSAYIGGYTTSAGHTVFDGVNGANGFGSSAGSERNANQTYEYLTIHNFDSNQNDAVMGDTDTGIWDNGNTYRYNTIGPNEYAYTGATPTPLNTISNPGLGGGYAVNMGSDTDMEYNCLIQNAQGAFNGTGNNINISHNEISSNGLGEYPDTGGAGASPNACGCSGGGKLGWSLNPTVDGNYVHDNYNTGIWLDFDNVGADISGNYVASNWSDGIAYEASYNANITDNTLTGNGWASDGPWPHGYKGLPCGGFDCALGASIEGGYWGMPADTISLFNSGGNPNITTVNLPSIYGSGTVTGRYSGHITVSGNVLTNNFDGMTVYTDTDRFPMNLDVDSDCGFPLATLNTQLSSTYYLQYNEVRSQSPGDAVISGNKVTTSTGLIAPCNADGSPSDAQTPPKPGWVVFDENSGQILGHVATVTDNHAFTLDNSPGNATGVRLMVSSYGGCGHADYFGSGPGVVSGNPPANYWDNCIWGSRNIAVSGNTFSLDAGVVANCTAANNCGFQQAIAFNAGTPALEHIFQNYPDLVADASGGLGNVWSANTYNWAGGGPGGWQFAAGGQGNTVTQDQWTSAPYGQDAGSTFNGSPPPTSPPPTSPPPTSPPPTTPPPTTSPPTSPPPASSLAYDATGPSATGKNCANCRTLSWSHTVSGASTALLAGVAVGLNDDTNMTVTATYNGVPMQLLKTVHDANQPDGFLDVFGLTGAPTGAHTVAVSVKGGNGTPAELTGGSESFNGAAQSGTFGTPVSAYGTSTAPAVAVDSSRAGDIIAGFTADGSAITSASSPATSRFIANKAGNTGAGNSAGATWLSNGSPVMMKWSAPQDYWGAIAVEVAAAS